MRLTFAQTTFEVKPDYNNAIRDIPWAGHIFVLARPIKGDWKDFDGTTMRRGREEFRPCMIRGIESGQRIYVIGSQDAYDLNQFEIQDQSTFNC